MKKIMMVYDQIQAGAGTKDDRMVPLKATKEVIGPAVMMERFLKANDEKIVACVYAGIGTWKENPEEIIRKITALAKKLGVDAVLCGPCFNYAEYAEMAAQAALSIQNTDGIPAIACMSAENEAVIEQYKNLIPIVKCPKKGAVGLNEALENMCKLASALPDQSKAEALEKNCCF